MTREHPPTLRQPLLRWSFWSLLLAVVVLSLLPTSYLPPQAFSLWDKAQHALGFLALGLLGQAAYPHRCTPLLLALLMMGGAIELAQAATGWRYGEWADWLADALGLLAASAMQTFWSAQHRAPAQH